jgi:hypothetical protein
MRNSPGVEYRQRYLGMFDTLDEARAARLAGERLFHKQRPRTPQAVALPPDLPAARHDSEFEVYPFLADLAELQSMAARSIGQEWDIRATEQGRLTGTVRQSISLISLTKDD